MKLNNFKRQKLPKMETDRLEDFEVLENILSLSAQTKRTAKLLAIALIKKYGSFGGVVAARTSELLGFSGLDENSVAAIKLVQTAALRLARFEVLARPVVNTPDLLVSYLTIALAHEPTEQVRVLFLDSRNHILADENHGLGTVNRVAVYPREIVKRALELNAVALILVHNHPSGDPTPSIDDVDMTREVQSASKALGITVHDHIIIAKDGCISFREKGLL